ncbi:MULTISPECIES: hypothetical protein [unclassified Dehalobacter]|uniref:hypothetical protein n=1 Tax=unclassified Dehalobacter TaxID=2635733 RepID=UPI00104B32B9|nr:MULTISPECIES: hypothetical protein [unclassified Dehalobacter]TCX51933.1 hypothetical protein C1I36_06345 [Dehalobacter sp. 14DCB1]TCX52993.1 hypothetical protein C1I38_08025 [Dehalobacter sp. 12DCB1]
MKLTNKFNDGACGIEQAVFAGAIKFNTANVATGVALVDVPANHIITKVVCKVTAAFDAGTTNVLTVGTDAELDDLLDASAVTEGTVGAYQANTWLETGAAKKTVKAKYTQTGTAAAAGAAEVYVFAMRLPE